MVGREHGSGSGQQAAVTGDRAERGYGGIGAQRDLGAVQASGDQRVGQRLGVTGVVDDDQRHHRAGGQSLEVRVRG
nr:hypothetical protein [Actinospica robiniae]